VSSFKSAELNAVPLAPQVDKPGYINSFPTIPDTIDTINRSHSQSTGDGYYLNTGGVVDDISFSQYNLDRAGVESPAFVETSGFHILDTDKFREDIRKEIRETLGLSGFTSIVEENNEENNSKSDLAAYRKSSDNSGINCSSAIFKENPPIHTSTTNKYLSKSTGAIPKTPSRVHFDSDLPQSRLRRNPHENFGDTPDIGFSLPRVTHYSDSSSSSQLPIPRSYLDRETETRTLGDIDTFTNPRGGITPTSVHTQNMPQELPYLDTPRPHRLVRKEKKDPQTYGGSTDLEMYLQHFELVAKYNKWTSAEKSQQLAISLKGDAQ
jgi:hypothetical protein